LSENIERVGKQGEKAFADLCNRLDCEYLHITQDKEGFSSKMWRDFEKRPDFFVNIPDIAPIFVEVKTKEKGFAGLEGILASVPAFGIHCEELERMQNFENQVGISTWYAFFENHKDQTVPGKAYTTPLSRIEKQIPKGVLMKLKEGQRVDWTIFVPVECMNEWGSEIDLKNKCKRCNLGYCKMSK
jgi:hypothetical protein